MYLEFSPQMAVKYSYPKFMKILPMEAELFCADGRADRQTDRQT